MSIREPQFENGNHVLRGMSDNSIAVWPVRPLTGVMRTEALAEVT